MGEFFFQPLLVAACGMGKLLNVPFEFADGVKSVQRIGMQLGHALPHSAQRGLRHAYSTEQPNLGSEGFLEAPLEEFRYVVAMLFRDPP